ncbi:hypothetical protein RRG08_026920 [Elysia crispata]|uniref:Uncharacterized protein n=1 Tax=Elysia crispata TaxID=231223 RepID=A0AAE1DA83_9GAST|nr:hypothetical protein RRG08_026920 [Elysia crispata]
MHRKVIFLLEWDTDIISGGEIRLKELLNSQSQEILTCVSCLFTFAKVSSSLKRAKEMGGAGRRGRRKERFPAIADADAANADIVVGLWIEINTEGKKTFAVSCKKFNSEREEVKNYGEKNDAITGGGS